MKSSKILDKMSILAIATALSFACVNAHAWQSRRGDERRLNPKEIAALVPSGAGAGTSGVTGIQTRVLKGDPTKPGLYTIELRVPAHVRIEAHTHPDDRVVTVVSGTWYFGYGTRHEEKALKALPPGSFYTEPPGEPHFARTGRTPVLVHITGMGPTGTHYTKDVD